MPRRKVDVFGQGKGSLANRLMRRRQMMEGGDVEGASRAAKVARRAKPKRKSTKR